MTHLIDAERLVETFAETDPHMPQIVFALLSVYLKQGPFEFDASALAEQLAREPQVSRLNAEKLAALQPDLERFFTPTSEGWIPRSGVLVAD
ncbi:hypothetical protein [Terricaulis sp.]|uniref:hypothetical protein n=1 Tax=Terricaulis sp. TaxID=2768686 RepID=UPI002AC7631A|nr:hypothetical protein [Terricaulis sp.]MDZ4690930.1 hypothetical protein [Terricaulis sp.]